MNPFSEITILSLEQATVLPYLTYRLAMDGARIIRLEHPKFGDPNRMVGEPIEGEERMNQYFLPINAGKEAITLNLGEEKGRELLKRLLKELKVDIFTTNQLPSSYEKLGIAPEILREVKPDLIWLGVSGFGPDHVEAAYDPILQARGGLMEMTGEAGGEPQVAGIPLPDMGTSEHAYGALMKALFARERTHEGATLHLSMFASTVSWLTVPITLSSTFGVNVTRRGNTHQFFSPVSVYPTTDGFIYLAVGNDRQWAELVKIPEFSHLDKPEYEKNLGRNRDVENLNLAMAEVTSRMQSADLIAKLKAIRLPVSKIQTIPELVADPLVKPMLLKSKDPKSGLEVTLAPPPYSTSFLEEQGNELSFPPRFGEHNAQVFGQLGLDQAALDDLKEQGII
jgi:crotonobetainyl-CoA:carnitine CoA-transferase CaiB-like acyl-CoA transferase